MIYFSGVRKLPKGSHKSGGGDKSQQTFKQFLSDTRADGVPSLVVTVNSDGGGKVCVGKFGDLCRSRCIYQEFTMADTTRLNEVAGRVLCFNDTAAMADRIQDREIFPGAQLPANKIVVG